MVVKSLGLAAVVLIAATSMASASGWHQGKHRTRVVIHPRVVGTDWNRIRGAEAYPAHIVPLAAYASPAGIGLTFQPFGWNGWRATY